MLAGGLRGARCICPTAPPPPVGGGPPGKQSPGSVESHEVRWRAADLICAVPLMNKSLSVKLVKLVKHMFNHGKKNKIIKTQTGDFGQLGNSHLVLCGVSLAS